jgi:serine/threonine-protein kinase
MTLTTGSKLGPYEILESIGSGGMGEVWKARDTRLGRIVAIKKVKEQHSERFKQEARSIASLNHPNICQIFDIGDNYLVLEYVEGKPLSSPQPEQEALRLAIQIASALEEAHQHGIIHRDLKPSNIMVTEKGSVKLLDFGLAKLYEQHVSISSLSTEDMPATQAGAILGTVAYMSPEQAQGKQADARSDIFSFGLVLYEMLSGKKAFSGESLLATAASLIKDEAFPLQASPSMQKIVGRCLKKHPSARYQTVSEVRAELEKFLAEKAPKTASEPQASIAVLPFVNISGDKEQEYFSDGLAEEIINALTKIPELKIPARTSSFYFRGKEADIQEISAKLNVKNILEGSVRKSGDRIRVTAQLINAEDGYHLWSERYDRKMTDVFAIQDEICQAIVDKLRVELSFGKPTVKRYTENIEAYNQYLKGRYYIYRSTQENILKGKKCCEQAVALDANYALAWFGIAFSYAALGYFGYMPPITAKAEALHAIEKALEFDETLAEAHAILAVYHLMEFEWKDAEKGFLRALELNPESVDVWHYYSYFYLAPLGRMEEYIAGEQKSCALDPLSANTQLFVGLSYYMNREWDRAIEQFRNALEIDPKYYLAHMLLGLAYPQIGKPDEAIRASETAIQIGGRSAYQLGMLSHIYAKAGRPVEIRALLDELHQLAEKQYVPPSSFARVYMNLGEFEKAFEWFEKAIDEGEIYIINLPVQPWYDPLRSHPRYKALLRKMNLEP